MLVREFLLDGSFMRFILLVTSPLVFCVSLFFALQLINSITFAYVYMSCAAILYYSSTLFFSIGPTAHYRENSKYFSAIPPEPVKIERLPHITIQMPVYKESCERVM